MLVLDVLETVRYRQTHVKPRHVHKNPVRNGSVPKPLPLSENAGVALLQCLKHNRFVLSVVLYFCTVASPNAYRQPSDQNVILVM